METLCVCGCLHFNCKNQCLDFHMLIFHGCYLPTRYGIVQEKAISLLVIYACDARTYCMPSYDWISYRLNVKHKFLFCTSASIREFYSAIEDKNTKVRFTLQSCCHGYTGICWNTIKRHIVKGRLVSLNVQHTHVHCCDQMHLFDAVCC